MVEGLYRKRGEASVAVGSVITLIVGVGVSVLVLIFVGSLGGQTYELVQADIDAIGNNVVVNESFVAVNASSVSLVGSPIQSGSLSVLNGSNSVGLGNFTVDYTNGALTLKNIAFNNTGLNASYTWGHNEVGTSVRDGIVASFNALDSTGSYLPIIVLAVVIALVLGLVFSFTSLGRGNMGGSAL